MKPTVSNRFSPALIAAGLLAGGITFAQTVEVDPLAAAASGGTIFWADYGGGIAGIRSKSVTIPEDNAPHVVRVTFPGGVKNLTQLRLDPASTAAKNVTFDYLRIYHYQPVSFTNVTLTASDIADTTSMNSAGNWNNASGPATSSFNGPHLKSKFLVLSTPFSPPPVRPPALSTALTSKANS